MNTSAFSVVIVSDYAPRQDKGWNDLRKMMSALVAQDRGEAVEFIYVERPEVAGDMPADLRTLLPRFRTVTDDAPTSYGLRNAGVRAATTPWVAMLDADCTPGDGWLQAVIAIIRDNPKATVISGRTAYPGKSILERTLALLSRAYVDRGLAGRTGFIAAHQCVFQRDAYLGCPLPIDAGVYSALIQSEKMLRDGRLLWFEPALNCVHDYEGWPMEHDIRRNTGHCTVLVRRLDPTMPYAWLTNLGPVAIPAIVVGKTWRSWMDCLRCGKYYDLAWFQLPFAFAVAVWVNLLEIGGMWTAYQGRPITNTAYR